MAEGSEARCQVGFYYQTLLSQAFTLKKNLMWPVRKVAVPLPLGENTDMYWKCSVVASV